MAWRSLIIPAGVWPGSLLPHLHNQPTPAILEPKQVLTYLIIVGLPAVQEKMADEDQVEELAEEVAEEEVMVAE